MIQQQRIMLMSRLAKLKKEGIDKSIKITNYYIEDYIYIKNFITRIFVLCILGGWVAVDIVYKVQGQLTIPSTLQETIIYYILPYGGIIVLGLIVYTTLSTCVYTKRYYRAQEQVEVYNDLLQQLEALDDQEDRGERDGKRRAFNS